jgi:hypothetical protein
MVNNGRSYTGGERDAGGRLTTHLFYLCRVKFLSDPVIALNLLCVKLPLGQKTYLHEQNDQSEMSRERLKTHEVPVLTKWAGF